ncbi:MAG: hypothetical protein Ta2E_03210 [Mycoplasmoidaceae bacterium]|nr:MAG: hypothetical protein Ta2E_03210 [Mycoplasmoidaceae bacterium]
MDKELEIANEIEEHLSDIESHIGMLDERIYTYNVNSNKSYKECRKLIKQKKPLVSEMLKMGNSLAGKELKRYTRSLSKFHSKNYRTLSAKNMLLLIEYVEKEIKSNNWHVSGIKLRQLMDQMLKQDIYAAKIKLVNNTKTSKHSKAKLLAIRRLEESARSSEYYVKNFFTSNAKKYYAKIVLRLEKMKKKNSRPVDNDAVIELRDVHKYYVNKYAAFKVLNGVNLKINRGEFVVVLGESGSGKTTMLNIISGMDNASYGEVVVCGESLINKSGSALTKFRKAHVGYVFQQYGLLPNLTVRENVEIGYNLQEDKNRRIDVDEILDAVGMYGFSDKFPYELSGGQQQRVSIARSISKNPTLLFGDEPTGAVDEKTSKEVLELFSKVNKKYGSTVIIVTHNPLIGQMADKVIKFANGNISEIITNHHPKKVDEIKWS